MFSQTPFFSCRLKKELESRSPCPDARVPKLRLRPQPSPRTHERVNRPVSMLEARDSGPEGRCQWGVAPWVVDPDDVRN